MWTSFLPRRLRLVAMLLLAFIGGVVSARWWDRPVAGTLRWELDPTLFIGDPKRHTVQLTSVTLKEVTDLLSGKFGRRIEIMTPADKRMEDRHVSLYVPNATLMDVLDILQAKYGLFAIEKGDAIGLCEQAEAMKHVVGRVYGIGPLIERLASLEIGGMTPFDDPAIARRRAQSWLIKEVQTRSVDILDLDIDTSPGVLYIRTTPIRHQRIAEIVNSIMHEAEGRR